MSEPVAALPGTGMGIYEIAVGLYQSGAPETNEDWETVFGLADVVVTLGESRPDNKPDLARGKMQIRWDIDDGPLPDLEQLDRLVEFIAGLVEDGTRVLVHCGAGINRSGLLSAMTMRALTGQDGRTCAGHVRDRRPGALISGTFNEFLNGLPPLEEERFPELDGGVEGGTSAEADNTRVPSLPEEGEEGAGRGGEEAQRTDLAAGSEAGTRGE